MKLVFDALINDPSIEDNSCFSGSVSQLVSLPSCPAPTIQPNSTQPFHSSISNANLLTGTVSSLSECHSEYFQQQPATPEGDLSSASGRRLPNEGTSQRQLILPIGNLGLSPGDALIRTSQGRPISPCGAEHLFTNNSYNVQSQGFIGGIGLGSDPQQWESDNSLDYSSNQSYSYPIVSSLADNFIPNVIPSRVDFSFPGLSPGGNQSTLTNRIVTSMASSSGASTVFSTNMMSHTCVSPSKFVPLLTSQDLSNF